ncbi:hypothetical protein JCM19236_6372 [Vibrio sp. JCM 19236]|nr:hypothetical protein JCM19236_6372 [Vibrio sp. JCM 19236]
MIHPNLSLIDETYEDYHFKSHALVYAGSDLTTRMMDMFALMLTHMKESDWDNTETPVYEFNSHQLSEWFGIDKTQLYAALSKPSKELASKKYGIEKDGEFDYFPILSRIRYKKGTLLIVPNPALREKYIANAKDGDGFAKVNNKIFLDLPNPNQKKVFEFLSRYRYDKEMYFTSIKKLQVIFGVYGEDGKLKKSSYKTPNQFINRMIAPALEAIANNEKAMEKLHIPTVDGKVGYAVEYGKDGQADKLRFLVDWKGEISRDEVAEVSRKIVDLMEKLDRTKRTKGDVLPILTQLHPLLYKIGQEQKASDVKKKIAELKAQRAKERDLKSKENVLKEVDKANLYLEKDFLSDI